MRSSAARLWRSAGRTPSPYEHLECQREQCDCVSLQDPTQWLVGLAVS